MAVGSPIGEAFVRVRADTTAFRADVQAGAALTSAGAVTPRLNTAALNTEARTAGRVASAELASGVASGGSRIEQAMVAPFRAGAKQIGGLFAAVAIAGAAIHIGKDIFTEGIAAQQSAVSVGKAFGEAAILVTKFDDAGAAVRGIDPHVAETFSVVFGSILQNAGRSRVEAANLSNSLVQLAADLSAIKHVEPERALTAFQGALAGNFRALRPFGIVLSQSTVQTEAFRLGLTKAATDSLTAGTRITATLSLLEKAAGFAKGAAASDTAAASTRRLSAEFKLLEEEAGQHLLPVITSVASFFATNLPGAAERTGQAFHLVGIALTPITDGLRLLARIPAIGEIALLTVGALAAAKALAILKGAVLGKVVVDAAAAAGGIATVGVAAAAATPEVGAMTVGVGLLSAESAAAAPILASLGVAEASVGVAGAAAVVRTGGLVGLIARMGAGIGAAVTSVASLATGLAAGGLAGAATKAVAGISGFIGSIGLLGGTVLAAADIGILTHDIGLLGKISGDAQQGTAELAQQESLLANVMKLSQDAIAKRTAATTAATEATAALAAEDAASVQAAGAIPGSATADAIAIHNEIDRAKFGSVAAAQAARDSVAKIAQAAAEAFDARTKDAFAHSFAGALQAAGSSVQGAAGDVGRQIGDSIVAGIDAASAARIKAIQSGIGPLGAASREANKLQDALDARTAAGQEKQLRANVDQAKNAGAADALQAQIDARNTAAQQASLQANVTAAKTPAALKTAQQALADFLTQQRIAQLRASKQTADAQQALQDFLDGQKIAKLRAQADKAVKVEEDAAAKKKAIVENGLKADLFNLSVGRIGLRAFFGDLLGFVAQLGSAGAGLRARNPIPGAGPGGDVTDRRLILALEKLAESLGTPSKNIIDAINIFDARNPDATAAAAARVLAGTTVVTARKR